MIKSANHIGVGSLLRLVGLGLLMSIWMLQVMAPSAAAFPSINHDHSQTAEFQLSACDMIVQHANHIVDASTQQNGHHNDAAHCMPSMCCFHVLFVMPQLAAIGVLLPSRRSIEQRTALSSHSGSTEDRPPNHA